MKSLNFTSSLSKLLALLTITFFTSTVVLAQEADQEKEVKVEKKVEFSDEDGIKTLPITTNKDGITEV